MDQEKRKKNLLSYWRASVADGELRFISLDNSSFVISLSDADMEIFVKGSVGRDWAGHLFGERKKRTSKKIKDGAPVRVAIAPFTMVRTNGSTSHGSSIRPWRRSDLPVIPVCILSAIDEDGNFSLDETRVWSARDLLSPSGKDDEGTFGTVSEMDAFLESHRLDTDAGWESVWNYALKMASAVFGLDWSGCDAGNFSESYQPALVGGLPLVNVVLQPDDTTTGVTRNLLDLYDYLISDQVALPTFYDVDSWSENSLKRGENSVPISSCCHIAQMSSEHALAPSQRIAVECFLRSDSISAITGPPGTGKTTLLQSVIANEYALAAIEGRVSAPMVLATSTNNKAVTNIISAFSHRPDYRWIEKGVNGFGIYFASKSALEKGSFDDGIHTADCRALNDTGLFAEIFDGEFLQSAEASVLAGCQCLSETVSEASEAVDLAHDHLVSLHTAICDFFRYSCDLPLLLERLKVFGVSRSGIGQELVRQKGLIEAYGDAMFVWERVVADEPWLLLIFGTFGFARRKRVFRLKRETRGNALITGTLSTIDDNLLLKGGSDVVLDALYAKKCEARDVLERLTSLRDELSDVVSKIRTSALVCELSISEKDLDSGDLDTPEIIQSIDTGIRYRIFVSAVHYWEARFVVALKQALFSRTKLSKEEQLNLLAMITPCFVATAYMAPTISASGSGLKRTFEKEMFDILIVDEAGQVTPEISGALFALAKKSIVVGDEQQIEPVWSVSSPSDNGNRRQFDLYGDKYPSSFHASQGNTMAVAKDMSGMFNDSEVTLLDHYRCRREIIDYCSQLAYGGMLHPKRSDCGIYSTNTFTLPAIGYGHIRGQAEKKGGSWVNRIEAEAIAGWIYQYREQIKAKGEIGDRVAVVTPFKAQAEVITRCLHKFFTEGGGTPAKERHNIVVGTVHAMQGAERNLVIFSPTYSAATAPRGTLFFDRGVNMLNVAVSRAKDSFLVFGDMGLLSESGQDIKGKLKPSALLARTMLREGNEVPLNPLSLPSAKRSGAGICRISGMKEHRLKLRGAIESAKHRVVIVSPYVTDRAIRDDNLCHTISEKIKCDRIHVLIVSDTRKVSEMDRNNKGASEALGQLKKAGAEIKMLPKIHSKSLCVDDTTLIEGSFNWLSSPRGGNWVDANASIMYWADGVDEMISQLIEELHLTSN